VCVSRGAGGARGCGREHERGFRSHPCNREIERKGQAAAVTLAARRLAAIVLRSRRVVRCVTRALGVRVRALRSRARDVRLQSNRQLKSQKCENKAGE